MTRKARQLLWNMNMQQIRKDFPHHGKILFLGWYKVGASSVSR